jgi:cell division control protein 7
MATTLRRSRDAVPILQDERVAHGDSTEDEEVDEMDESKGPMEESGCTVSDDEEEEIDGVVLEDIERFEASFKNITQRYRLINRIGEGTFSTVYKAEDLLYEHYKNEWDLDAEKENVDANGETTKKTASRPSKPRYVAIKKIYVTSSPLRILNELELLHDLRDSPNVCPLITSFRHQDQVIAILPFFQHRDFRDYYRDFTLSDMRVYFQSLFTALRSVHEAGIIHRDIKPTNFLYSPGNRRGVLVDFGLAEREGTDYHHCACVYETSKRNEKINNSVYASTLQAARAMGQEPRPGYPANDQRSSRRANRAGTRGFRAPEVLLKCTAQTSQIDVWSCGVILLTFLSKRFPFFHSADDIDAFIELCTIFGKKRMRECALLHGQVLHSNLPTISEGGHTWEKILLWCTNRGKKGSGADGGLTAEETEAVEFMKCCLELDHHKRATANELLQHPWLAEVVPEGASDGEDVLR